MGQHNGVDSDDSLIPMSGPKRGIGNQACALIEFDMKIKNGETEDDDFQLIDSAITCSEFSLPERVFTERIEGDCGAVDISRALLHSAVEATIQVSISQVRGNGFSLSLHSCIGQIPEKIQLFDGVISKACDLDRFVVAVVLDTPLFLAFKVDRTDGFDYVPGYCTVVFNKVDRDGSDHVYGYCPFKARTHGCDMKNLKLGCAYVVVKVSWSTLK